MRGSFTVNGVLYLVGYSAASSAMIGGKDGGGRSWLPQEQIRGRKSSRP